MCRYIIINYVTPRRQKEIHFNFSPIRKEMAKRTCIAVYHGRTLKRKNLKLLSTIV